MLSIFSLNYYTLNFFFCNDNVLFRVGHVFSFTASKLSNLEEVKQQNEMLKAFQAVAVVGSEVDKLCDRVSHISHIIIIIIIIHYRNIIT